jgi:arginine exporter protein ArgO
MLDYRETIAVERLKNAASNGRLLNILTFALVLFVTARFDQSALWLAFFPIVSLGAAYLSDVFGQMKTCSVLSIVFAIVPFAVAFYI